MKTKLNLVVARMFCAVALGIGLSVSPAAAAGDSPDIASAKTSVPWSQLGAKAGADYQGDGLAVTPTAEGARLRCVFQQLEAEATREGLWLISTVSNAVNERFRVTAVGVERGTVSTPNNSLTPAPRFREVLDCRSPRRWRAQRSPLGSGTRGSRRQGW